jgi:NAD(P)-dependent dehydrogenase (short-subunit alcohol dehydrogenase family)
MKRLEDKVAVVTGGGSGIGKAICLEYAREGAHVIVVSNIKEEAEGVAAEVRSLGREGISYVTDVTDAARVKEIAGEVKEKFGKTDILVTSAGIMGERTLLTNMTEEGWRRTIEINLNAGFYCIKMISSVSGKLPAALNSDYAASKHGVIGLTKAIALEMGLLGLKGITANAICPGNTNTHMITDIVERMRPLTGETSEKFLQDRVLTIGIQKRLLDPEEIAYMAVYLASDEARGVTGQAMNVCGGTVLW